MTVVTNIRSLTVGDVVTHKVVKHVPCSRCGTGRIRRTKTLRETLREHDRPEGILAILVAEGEDWRPTATHPPCQCPHFTQAAKGERA